MRLAFYLNGPGSYAHLEPVEAMTLVRGLGFTAIDVSASGGQRVADSRAFPRSARQRMRSAATNVGLEVSAVVTHLGLADTLRESTPLDLIDAVQVANDLDAPLVLVHIGSRPGDPSEAAWRWARAIEAVRAAADAAAPTVTICLDAVAPDFLTRDVEEVGAFLLAVDRRNVGWNLDPAYLAATDVALDHALDRLAGWIRHCHLKDVRRHDGQIEWLIPGDGELDLPAVFAALARIRFDGTVTAEVIARPKGIPERWPISVAARRSFHAMHEALGRVVSADHTAPGPVAT